MAQQVLGGIGAIIGGYFGGAAGAQWGWAIGSAIGGAIDPQTIRGPRIGDIARQTSQEGTPRPIFFAKSPPIAGNIIASSEPQIVRRRQSQGKGGPKVETESVYRTYAIGVGEGPINRFLKIWRNGQLVYDVDTLDGESLPPSSVTLLTGNNQAFLTRARFFLGTFDQTASPDLESVFGAGLTPAHRGTAYMVMANEDLTDLRGAIPQWTFQVERCATPTAASIVVLTDAVAEVDGDPYSIVATAGNFDNPLVSQIEGTYAGATIDPTAVAGFGSAILACGKVSESQYWRARSANSGLTWGLANWNPAIGLLAIPGIVACSPTGTQYLCACTLINITDPEEGVFVGDSIIYGPDGITWDSSSAISDLGTDSYGFSSVDWVTNRWFASGNAGICTSTDGGAHWVQRHSGAVNAFKIFQFEDTYIAACSSELFVSADGESWASMEPEEYGIFNRSIACGNGVCVKINHLGWSRASSPTGEWTNPSMPGIADSLTEVIFDGERFLMIGGTSSSNPTGALVLSSIDAQSWEIVYNNPAIPRGAKIAVIPVQ